LLECANDVNFRRAEGMLHERERFIEDRVDIDFDKLRRAGSREIQKVVDDFAGAESLLHDLIDRLLLRIVRGKLLRKHLDIVRNHSERRIYFMRHAGR
jgi:hypothetical protein